jgi:hypothetical protein
MNTVYALAAYGYAKTANNPNSQQFLELHLPQLFTEEDAAWKYALDTWIDDIVDNPNIRNKKIRQTPTTIVITYQEVFIQRYEGGKEEECSKDCTVYINMKHHRLPDVIINKLVLLGE